MERSNSNGHQVKSMDAGRPRGRATAVRGPRHGRIVLVAALAWATLSAVDNSFAQEPVGACCDQATFGGCSQTTSTGCACPTCTWYEGQACSGIACVHTAIPTVSEWGLVVLALLLLTGAKLYFGRRRQPVESV